MSKFKVGDKVRAVISDVDYGLLEGSVHTVTSVHPMGHICLAETGSILWYPERFELVQNDDVLTPEEVFTPKRLLGVKTDHGYIQDVGIFYVTTTAYHFCALDTLKFYISDESDETVSFEEYVKMFYKGGVYGG